MRLILFFTIYRADTEYPKVLSSFFIALQFLTRIPVSSKLAVKDEDIGNSLLFYPLVGLLIGILLAITAFLCQNINAFLAAVLVVTVWVSITGGLHLDGLADSFDAWIGGCESKERTLEIMKDPASGPMGVLSLILLILLKTAAVYTLLSAPSIYYLLLPPVLGRSVGILLLATTPYVRAGGLGEALTLKLDKNKIWIVSGVVALLILLSTTLLGILLIGCGMGLLCVARYVLLKCLDGCTGDTTGALIEITETVALLVIVIYV